MSGKSLRPSDCPRIRAIHLNRWERLLRATVWTRFGLVKIAWRDLHGETCWFSSGRLEAKREAVLAIERIEQMCQPMH